MMTEKPLLKVLGGKVVRPAPIWLMRQAGRHLAEYRELRARARDFLDFCYTPSLATEATLQPIRRYGMDGAILFADILLVLDVMGLGLEFRKGEGPVMKAIDGPGDLERVPVETVVDKLSPVYETVRRVRAELPEETTLIGFAGSPWTVAVYAIEGRGGTDKTRCKLWAHQRADELDAVLNRIADATIGYLEAQADAGADALMLFDSWAEGLPDDVFERVSIAPTKRVVDGLRARGVKQPIIGFPRGAGMMLEPYATATGVTAVGMDTAIPPAHIGKVLPEGMAVQGNLDPLLLLTGGDPMRRRIHEILDALADRPHIFNLGHGVTPDVPPEHVADLVKTIRERG